jgi:hypothetical protein
MKDDGIKITLSAPTVFPDLNRKEGKEEGASRNEIEIKRLKFKHFKKLNDINPEEQMVYAITELTGLSESDIDELYAEDAGAITKVIIGFMQSFMDIAKNVLNPNPR